MDESPTEDIVDNWNWSTGSHVAPVWYGGIPASSASTSALDQAPSLVPVAPYIQVLRSGAVLQGISASSCDGL